MPLKTTLSYFRLHWTRCANCHPTEASCPPRKEEMAERIVTAPAKAQPCRGMRLLTGILIMFSSL
jgi:hypothetical protein